MRKFIDSQVKSKDERQAEKEVARAEREEKRAAREQARLEKERESGGGYGAPLGHYNTGGTGGTVLPGSGAEFDSGPHHRHFSDRRIANPAPLGLFAFSFSTFLLGLINVRAQGVTETTALVGPFLMYSSIMMGITAIFELIAGNTFGATAFGTFAGFFLSLGAILLPSFGTFTIFAANPLQIYNFLGLFFATWLIPFGIFCFLTIRSTWTLWLQFIFIFVSLAVSCAQYLKTNDPVLQRAAGGLLIVVSFFGYLNGTAGLASKETVFFQPPLAQMPWASDNLMRQLKGPDHPHNQASMGRRGTYPAQQSTYENPQSYQPHNTVPATQATYIVPATTRSTYNHEPTTYVNEPNTYATEPATHSSYADNQQGYSSHSDEPTTQPIYAENHQRYPTSG